MGCRNSSSNDFDKNEQKIEKNVVSQVTDEIIEIKFGDENFEEYIRSLLGKKEGAITNKDVLTIKEINYWPKEKGLESLAGIEYFKNLEVLEIVGYRDIHHKVQSLEPLRGLNKMQILIFMFGEVKDISALSELSELRVVDLRFNKINETDSLNNLNQLEAILIDNNPIIDNNNPLFLNSIAVDADKKTPVKDYMDRTIGEHFNDKYLHNFVVAKNIQEGKIIVSTEILTTISDASADGLIGFERVYLNEYDTVVDVGVAGLRLVFVFYDSNGTYLTHNYSKKLFEIFEYKDPNDLKSGLLILNPLVLSFYENLDICKSIEYATVGFIHLEGFADLG